jgi:hypothetical protein
MKRFLGELFDLAKDVVVRGKLSVGKNTVAVETLDVVGNIAVTGNVDGVDISSFKSSYDSHNHNTWTTVSGTSQSIASSAKYLANNAARVSFSLPGTASVGDTVEVAGIGAGGWRITQAASQLIIFGNVQTTTGVSGYIESTHLRDSVRIVCVVANTTWQVLFAVGNIEVV